MEERIYRYTTSNTKKNICRIPTPHILTRWKQINYNSLKVCNQCYVLSGLDFGIKPTKNTGLILDSMILKLLYSLTIHPKDWMFILDLINDTKTIRSLTIHPRDWMFILDSMILKLLDSCPIPLKDSM